MGLKPEDIIFTDIPSAELMVSWAFIEKGIKEGDLTDEGGLLSGWVEAARAEVARRAKDS